VASYDAEINLIVSGFRQIRELEDRLTGIQNTIEEINDLGANAVMGRSTDMSSYSRVLRYLESSRNAIANQAAEQQRANASTRQQLLLYSQLNQEQSRFRRRSSAFTEESRGVRETNSRVIELTTQLRSAQRAFGQLFAEADIQGVRTINSEISSLLEELREINRVATGVKNVGANTGQLQAQADRWQMEVRALRQRASLLSENEEILARLLTAERNLIELRNADMTFREDANVRLGRQELANAAFLIKTEEDLANRRRKDASDYERQLQKQTQAIQQQAKQFGSLLKEAGKVSSAIFNAVTFDNGAQIAKGAKNAAIRGGVGLGALGLGKAAFATSGAIAAMAQQTASQAAGFKGLGMLDPMTALATTNQAIIKTFGSIGGAINDALGGVPGIVADMLSAIGQIPDSLGLAAVAAFAFAPAIKSVSTGLYNLGKAAGETKIGSAVNQFLTNVNPLATAAYGSIEALTNGLDQLRGKALNLQQIAAESKALTEQLNDAYEKLPLALPAAGQTSFKGAVEYSPRIGAFVGGGARSIQRQAAGPEVAGALQQAYQNAEFLADATGKFASRSQMAADSSRLFAEGLGQAASEAKTIADYLEQAAQLQTVSESSTQRFIRQTRERGRVILENQKSEQIARERSALLLGGQYSIQQVPARGELFPGGRTETRQPDYRAMLNQAAQAQQAADQSLNTLRQRAIESLNLPRSVIDAMTEQQKLAAANEQIERRTLGNVSEGVAARRTALGVMRQEQVTQASINAENERSVEIIRARNRELRATPVAAMSPAERIPNYPNLEGATLDPESLRAQRRRRIEIGRLDPLERFYAGFQPRRQAARSARATSEGLIGGAFPLLFGQGLGASVGGGLGGALGGFAGGGLGFGLSLIGTALGTAFDTTIQKAKELGDALRDSSKTFDLVKERALFSSRETEKLATKLQEAGYTASAATLAQQEIISKIGVGGAQSLEHLSDASDKLNRAWAEFTLQLQAALAGPMAGLLEWITAIIAAGNSVGREATRQSDILAGLSPKDRKRLLAEQSKILSGINIFNEAGARQEVSRLYTRFAPLAKSGRTVGADQQQQQLNEAINAYQKQLEAIDIGKSLRDQVRQAAREQQDLDKQRADLVRSYEENIAQIRKRVEDEIARRRFSILEKENQLLDLQGQNRLKALQIANKQFIAGAGAGERPEVEQAAKRAAEIVAQFTEGQVSAEEEAAKIKRDAALDARKFDYEAAQFKANIEQEVSRLNIETARRVAEINEQVRRRNEEYNSNRFSLEKAIAKVQYRRTLDELDAARAANDKELEILRARNSSDLQTLDRIQFLENLSNIYMSQREVLTKGQKELEKIAPPAKLRGVGAVGGGGVPTTNLDEFITKEGKTLEKITQEQLSRVFLQSEESLLDFKSQSDQLVKDLYAPLRAINLGVGDELKESIRYTELLRTGVRGVVAEKIIELEKTKAITKAQLQATSALVKTRLEQEQTRLQSDKTLTDTNRQTVINTIQGLKYLQNKLDTALAAIDGDSAQTERDIRLADRGSQIRDFVNQATSDLNDLESVAIRVSQSIGDAVGQSLTSGVTSLIDGTATAQEVFANFMKSIADVLMQEAAKMIATYTAIGIAKMFAGIFGSAGGSGAAGGGGVSVNPATGAINPVPSLGGLAQAANGAYFSGGMSYFANGGMFTNSIVKSPTLFKFADGGALRSGVMGEAGPEAVMPLSRGSDGRLGVTADIRPAMNRYRQATGSHDGSAQDGSTESTGGAVTTAPASIDVRYTVERINSVDYVTADQFQRGMQQAATQGAQRGEQATLRRLQQSSSTRRRLGM
jgi:hypothetical protein